MSALSLEADAIEVEKDFALDPERTLEVGQSVSALPQESDIDPLCYCEIVIQLDALVADDVIRSLWKSKSWTARSLPVRRSIGLALVLLRHCVHKRAGLTPISASH